MEFLGIPLNLSNLLDVAVAMIGKLIIALLIFFIGKWLVNKIVLLTRTIMNRSNLDSTIVSFLSNLLYGVLLVIVVLAALNKLGVNTTSFVAILGGATVAIGVSLKDQLSNFAAGVMIVIFRPFNRGDQIEINGKVGIVQEITLINTRLTTINNHEIIIPNGDFTTNTLINYSSRPTRRVDLLIGISYGADIKKAKNIILNLAKNHPKTEQSFEPLVHVTDLGDNAVQLTLKVWALNENWADLQFDLLEQIKYAFDDNDIEMPFPQRTLHIEGLADILKPNQ